MMIKKWSLCKYPCGKGYKMNKIYIAIEGNTAHRASVYALCASLVINKNAGSRYVIHIIAKDAEKNYWGKLQELACDNVEIKINKENVWAITETDRVICLQWNTLVMGDLTELYNIDLEGKSFGAIKNLPEEIRNIPFEYKKYNDAVRVIDITQRNEEADDCKELATYFNYGYEEYIKYFDSISKQKIEKGEVYGIKDWALILRMDTECSPENYFDTLLADIWLKYYKLSPLKDIALNRQSSLGICGSITVDSKNSIPILLTVKDCNVSNVIELIRSMSEHIMENRQLDIRILYEQLSATNTEELLKLKTENISIVLYNVRQVYPKDSFEIWCAQVFDHYEKAICIQPNAIMVGDISGFYDTEIGEYWLGTGKEPVIDETILLINVKEWKQHNIGEKIHTLWQQNPYAQYSISEMLNILCRKKLMWMDIGKYVCLCKEKEDENLKEVLNQISDLEKENSKLKEKNRQLQAEKTSLQEERDQYLYEILETRKSFTYKVGRAITFIPRKLRGKKVRK